MSDAMSIEHRGKRVGLGGRTETLDREPLPTALPLGAGGMGRVWRAHDQQLDVDVAVKEVFRPSGIPDHYWQELLLRAERESRHGARLRNRPNIVAVFDVGIENGIPWTVMRLVNGTTLEERLTRGRLPVSETAKIAELHQRATDLDIPHRSTMTRDELQQALEHAARPRRKAS
ncbi:hypothetical protein [Kitasatospora sp. NPDC094011]|uniref:hypothetical protein n=1 Tax=Kitasatospora sp. NPDC094011 TaxID=3364090 RepID=UPI00382A26C0